MLWQVSRYGNTADFRFHYTSDGFNEPLFALYIEDQVQHQQFLQNANLAATS